MKGPSAFLRITLYCLFAVVSSSASHAQSSRLDSLMETMSFYAEEERWERAIATATEYLRADTNSLNVLFHRAEYYFQNGDWYSALQDYNTMIAIDSENLEARMHRPQILMEYEEFATALDDLYRVIQVGMADEQTYMLQGMAAMAMADKTDSVQYLQLSHQAFSKAIYLWEVVDAYYFRAFISEQLGNYADAVADYETFKTKIDPDSHLYLAIGTCKINAEQFGSAIRDLELCMELQGDSTYAGFELGRAYIGMREYKKALQWLQVTTRRNPQFADAHYHTGLAFQGLGKTDEAKASFTTSNELYETADNYFQIGMCLAEDKSYDDAIKYFSNALLLDLSDKAEAYAQRGRCYVEKEQYVKAIEDYTASLEARPQHISTLTERAYAYTLKADRHADNKGKKDARTNYQLALDDLHLAMRHSPYNTAIADTIQEVEKKMKKLE